MVSAPRLRARKKDALRADPGSFRDPSGGVVLNGTDTVYRYFTSDAADDFVSLMESGLLESLAAGGSAVATRKAGDAEAKAVRKVVPKASLVVEHPRIPFVSYAYEWPFEMLQAAALSHLDTMREGLGHGFMLKDATPFNIQFAGANPLLIDVASFEAHEDGAAWAGYTQFCRTFLNPLLFQSITGVPFQPWLRASLDGIDPAMLSRLLPLRHKLRPSIFMHVVLQAWLNRKLSAKPSDTTNVSKRRIPRDAILNMAEGLRGHIARMRRRKDTRWSWADYERALPYTAEALAAKEQFVEQAVAAVSPKVLWDLGANTGRFTLIAARHSENVVAFDMEEAAVGALYERVREEKRENILPLVMDLSNASPDQGWAQEERRGLLGRGPADFAMSLALVHHLRISGNVPVARIAEWLAAASNAGIVEFVPKADAMVRTLLRTRPDVYDDYTQQTFEHELERHFEIVEVAHLPGSQRVLYRYESRTG